MFGFFCSPTKIILILDKGHCFDKIPNKTFSAESKDGLADLIDGTSKIRNQSRTFWSEGIDRKSDTNSQVHHYKKYTHCLFENQFCMVCC